VAQGGPEELNSKGEHVGRVTGWPAIQDLAPPTLSPPLRAQTVIGNDEAPPVLTLRHGAFLVMESCGARDGLILAAPGAYRNASNRRGMRRPLNSKVAHLFMRPMSVRVLGYRAVPNTAVRRRLRERTRKLSKRPSRTRPSPSGGCQSHERHRHHGLDRLREVARQSGRLFVVAEPIQLKALELAREKIPAREGDDVTLGLSVSAEELAERGMKLGDVQPAK
jgi:hypothetical protein